MGEHGYELGASRNRHSPLCSFMAQCKRLISSTRLCTSSTVNCPPEAFPGPWDPSTLLPVPTTSIPSDPADAARTQGEYTARKGSKVIPADGGVPAA